MWTHATANSARENFGVWTVRVDVAGRYKLSVYTDSSVATSQFARYRIEHDGVVDTRQVDQRAIEGFRDLGVFDFGAGVVNVVLNDNTGEPISGHKKIVFDALKVVPTTEAPPPPPAPAPTCTRVRVINASQGLNIRSSPSTANAAVGTLSNGSIVDRLSSVDGQSINGNRTWHKIKKGSTTGYVSAYYTACVN